jgi:hypothetical protein
VVNGLFYYFVLNNDEQGVGDIGGDFIGDIW